jgi:hypothetical protein
MGQGLSKESKFVKIGRLEPRFSCRQRKSLKVKMFIPRLKPVKDKKGLTKNKKFRVENLRHLDFYLGDFFFVYLGSVHYKLAFTD